ncbi:MAG: DUF1653 domain-containing protein, partial [Pirellulaceae bacterium]
KGMEYVALGLAIHSETHEEFVVYQPDYGERRWWIRPRAMFEESVIVDGQATPRFAFLGGEAEPPSASQASRSTLPEVR